MSKGLLKSYGFQRWPFLFSTSVLVMVLLAACGREGQEPQPSPPQPTVAPLPFPTPTSTIPPGTKIRLPTVTLASQQQTTLAIRAEEFTVPDGLGAYELVIEFDNAVIRVDESQGGEGVFSGPPQGVRIDNANGVVHLASFHGQFPGPTGDFTIAQLVITAIGGSGSFTDLRLTVNGFFDAATALVEAYPIHGRVSVQ